jgi:hypothetical protein
MQLMYMTMAMEQIGAEQQQSHNGLIITGN